MIVAKKRTAKENQSTKDSQQDPYRIETTCLHREDQKIADQGKDSHKEGQDDRDTLSCNDFRIWKA